MSAFKTIELFGGAMRVELPQRFVDVSDMRQVPDNQEVYIDADGLTSIVFDVLERVDKPDLEALKYHLSDIMDDDEDDQKTYSAETWSTNSAVLSKLPPRTPAYTLLATQPSSPQRIANGKAPDLTGVLVTLIRLEKQQTDLVVTINVPHAPGEYNRDSVDPGTGKLGRLLEDAVRYRERVLQTFEILDWGLFVQD